DIVMLKADRLDIWPLSNAPGTVVNFMNPGHVETVFIAGKVKKWRGSLVGVDVARVVRTVQEARGAVMGRAKFKGDLLAFGSDCGRATSRRRRPRLFARLDELHRDPAKRTEIGV